MVFLSTLVAPAAWGQSTGAPAEPASDSGKVPEIIVTAQRRSESLQNTPVAVTAITGDALAARHIDDISNISAVSPSVNFQSTNNAQASANLEIRGIGTVGNNRAFEGSVGVFVDGVYLSRVGQCCQISWILKACKYCGTRRGRCLAKTRRRVRC